ncbi:hypothetical protein [Halorubrum aethiopicum]|uniref:hypothetical protein n=1 Tax=Halorubrum aethiopicum TaxID=1758255 RepID=UPI0008353ED9|nr:hypothetical protein [Halorubrum aethiopicum]
MTRTYSDGSVRWSSLTIDELVEAYWETIAPAMRADGMDPETEHPPYRWVADRFRGLIYTLSERHDRTPREFFREDVGVVPYEGYDWELAEDDHEVMVALSEYIESLQQRDLAESTIEATRSRIAAYARRFERRNDVRLTEPHSRETAVETLLRVARRYVTRDAKRHLVSDVRSLCAWLAEEGYHDEHVLEGVELDDVVEG